MHSANKAFFKVILLIFAMFLLQMNGFNHAITHANYNNNASLSNFTGTNSENNPKDLAKEAILHNHHCVAFDGVSLAIGFVSLILDLPQSVDSYSKATYLSIFNLHCFSFQCFIARAPPFLH